MSKVTGITRRVAIVGATFLPLSGIFPLSGSSHAQSSIPAETARQYVQSLGSHTVDVFNMARAPEERRTGLTRLMLSALDFDAIATMVLGKMARAATPQQKREMNPLFAAYIIDVAVEKFGDMQGMRFGVGSVKPQPNGDAKVYTRIHTSTDDRPMEVMWRVRSTPSGPRINDVELDGSSLVVHYRGEFERDGSETVAQLIGRLRELTKGSRSLPLTQQAMR